MESSTGQHDREGGAFAPLRIPVFRRIWIASALYNLGIMIMSVGAAWTMTQLTPKADMIALVQAALMLPIMLLAVPAGAAADMYDRRRIGLIALSLAFISATALSVLAGLGHLSPWTLLLFCSLVGSGMALFGPSWQASVSEQVPVEMLPHAIALNSISFNIARSVGPAIGGIIVAVGGAMAAFSLNAVLCIPFLLALLMWKRLQEPSRLPPERLYGAINSGFRYVLHSPSIRRVLSRTLLTALAGGSIAALMPLVARDLLGGTATTYGLILGAFGVGAVTVALQMGRLRSRFRNETIVVSLTALLAIATLVLAFSHSLPLTMLALLLAGAAWMGIVTIFNVAIQLSAPRWVAGRTLAAFQMAVAGGIAIGSWCWGHLAQWFDVSTSLAASAILMALIACLGRWLRMPSIEARDREPVGLSDPEVTLALTGRSGPIVIEIEYRVDPAKARAFHGAMQQVQRIRHRNGGYDWSIARDITDAALWTERYHCPTWHDYLRLRNRYTPDEMACVDHANSFHCGPGQPRILRRLERPFGSVRWRDDAPDRGTEVLPVTTPLASG
jgi:MFS family permease